MGLDVQCKHRRVVVACIGVDTFNGRKDVFVSPIHCKSDVNLASWVGYLFHKTQPGSCFSGFLMVERGVDAVDEGRCVVKVNTRHTTDSVHRSRIGPN